MSPRIRVREVEVTQADRDAMLHKHPIEIPPVEVGRTQVSPTETVVTTCIVSEVYRHEENGVVKIYNIREIKDLIYTNDIPVKALQIYMSDEYVSYIFTYGGCEQSHVDRVTEKDIERPAIGVFYPDGLQIIDGTHRIVAQWRRFNKKKMRILVVPGELEHLFLIDQDELVDAVWLHGEKR